jgi:Holliday junction resolvase RusA-like endonuclease
MQVTQQQINICFFGNVPSKKNGKQWIQRGKKRYLVPSAAYTAWERSELARLKATVTERKLTGFHITIAAHFPDNRIHDLDNLECSIMDCLKSSGIIKDDSWQCMSSPTTKLQPTIDRLNPRVEITIIY